MTGVVAALACLLGQTAYALECGGTEPFWNLKIGAGQIEFDEMDRAPLRLRAVRPRAAKGAREDFVRVYETRMLRPPHQPVTIVVREAEGKSCSDNMSDTVYPYSVVIVMPDSVLVGCCNGDN